MTRAAFAVLRNTSIQFDTVAAMIASDAATPPATFLQLVADPQRWMLLSELAASDRRVGELCTLVDRPQNLVSYHLRVLRAGGLITSRRSAADGRDTYYRVDLTRCGEMFASSATALHPGLRLGRLPSTAPRVSRGRVPRVLFLCTGNSARSQIAQAVLEHRCAGAVTARSAGSHPKPLHPEAVRVMAERGIDIAGRPTTHVDTLARRRFDHVITLCDKVREVCPDLPGHPTTAHWSVAEPDTPASFDRTADEIEERVEFLIARLSAGS